MTKPALLKMIQGTQSERLFLAEQSFGLFALYYFKDYFKYPLAPFHYNMVSDLHSMMNGEYRELAWIMFRESAKTTFAKLFIIWMICHNKRKYINIDSYDKENAERILFDVAFELVNNKRLRADYGTLFSKERGINDVKQNRINNFITENGIRVEAHSTQESVRGRIHLNQRPDFLLADDIETNKTKESKAYTRQVRDHISEALAGMAPNGCILYLGNYITEHGNIQYLIDRAKNDPYLKILNVPVVQDGKPTWEGKYALTDEEAKKLDKVSIEDKKRQLGSYVFSYEMMNQPVDEANSLFKKDYLQTATEQEVEQLNTDCFITIDPAISTKDSADFTGVTINYVSDQNKWYIKTLSLKLSPKDLVDKIFELYSFFKPSVIGIEETSFTITLKPYLDDEMRRRSVFLPIKALKHGGNKKEDRIRSIIPRWESKSIYLVGDNHELLEQMRAFPHSAYDDVLDSLAYQEQIAEKPNEFSNEDINDILQFEEIPMYEDIGL